MKQIRKINKIYAVLLIFAVLSAVLNTGCGGEGYVKPITKFRDASSVVIESTRVYISELNKTERDIYILGQLGNGRQIDGVKIDEVQVFSKEGLQARMDALDVLGDYGDLLLKLASSDAPEKIATQTNDLKDALTKLSGTVAGVTGAPDAKFKAAIPPVTRVLGVVLDLVVRKKIEDGLNVAIKNGEKPISKLIQQIGDDLENAYLNKVDLYSGLRRDAILAYNDLQPTYEAERTKPCPGNPTKYCPDGVKLISLRDKMSNLAQIIRDREDKFEELANSNPKQPLIAMARAHTALINFAKSQKKAADFASLVDAMDFFAQRAEQFGEAVQELRNL